MFSVGAHYGCSRARRHPSVAPYIYGTKEKLEIIDLTKTAAQLARAKEFAHTLGAEGKVLLMVGGKSEAQKAVRETAESLGLPYVAGRWIGGTLSNFPEIKKRVARLETLRTQREKGELAKYTKREQLMFDREIAKLEEKFGGLMGMEALPQALLVVDPRFEHIAVREAREFSLPVIALASTDCDIAPIAYPIVANDAARASIAFFVEEIGKAYGEGMRRKKEAAAASPTAEPGTEEEGA